MKISEKNVKGFEPDPKIADKIRQSTKSGALPCAVAFEIAKSIGVAPLQVGRTADSMNVSLSKCQLGLFGYKPNKKIVEPRPTEKTGMPDVIRDGLVEDRLPCATAWRIAANYNISKLSVANACEALGIKIKPCQLGAF
jgi:hypothetical protein